MKQRESSAMKRWMKRRPKQLTLRGKAKAINKANQSTHFTKRSEVKVDLNLRWLTALAPLFFFSSSILFLPSSIKQRKCGRCLIGLKKIRLIKESCWLWLGPSPLPRANSIQFNSIKSHFISLAFELWMKRRRISLTFLY